MTSSQDEFVMTGSGLLHQQMGEVLRGLKDLADTIDLRNQQMRELHDIVRADIATLRQDQRDLEEKLDCVIYVAQHDLETLRLRAADDRHSVDELIKTLHGLRHPVAEIMAFRSRVGGLVVGLAVVGSALLWLAEPFYRWLIDHNLPRQ